MIGFKYFLNSIMNVFIYLATPLFFMTSLCGQEVSTTPLIGYSKSS